MSLSCTRCDNSGFINIGQVPDELCERDDVEETLKWVKANTGHDVTVCECCGDGEECWHGIPGEHYNDDKPGKGGPYEYNGGLCECH